jgi:polysaccharide biosynthesis protein PslG
VFRKFSVLGTIGLIALLLLTSGPVATYGQQGSQTPTPQPKEGERYFPETGFIVPAVFLRYWDANGGLPVFGFPISEARTERSLTDGKDYLVQYFERNRFEHHPEFAGTKNEVLLGLLGAELTRGRTFEEVAPFTDTPTKIYLVPTKHSLAEPFLSYWRKYGGLAIFGYPISEPFDEVSTTDGKTYKVQYFQRNRFEYHPENQPPYDVLLGLLGKDFMELQSLLNVWGPPIQGAPPVTPPIWKPAKPAVGGNFLKGPAVGDGMIIQGYYQDTNRIYNMVNDLSFTWVKQQVEWKNTEDPKGSYHWDEIDRIVNAAQAKKVKVLLSIVKAPVWATGGKQGFPRQAKDMGDFMKAMAAHFKGRVDAYEIWNEYNLVGEAGEINPGRYVELLKEAYLGVKSQDADAIIVAGALTPTGVNDPEGKRAPGAEGALSDTRFLEEMYLYKDGMIRQYFDAMGSHPYGFNNPPDSNWPDNPNLNPSFPRDANGNLNYYNRHNSFYFRRIEEQRAIMEKYGDGQKQMWLTEYGWCSDFRSDGYGECRFNTKEQQGEYIVGAINRAKKYYPWMGVMFLWNLNFATFQPWYTGPSHFSILNGDWSARPAYFTIKNRQK